MLASVARAAARAALSSAALARAESGVRVVLDCSFGALMTCKEQSSLRGQVAAAVCLNARERRAPLRLLLTSVAEEDLLELFRSRGAPLLGWPCDMLADHFAVLLEGGDARAAAAVAVVAAEARLDAAAAAAASPPEVAGQPPAAAVASGAASAPLVDLRARLPALLNAHYTAAHGADAAAAALAAVASAPAVWPAPARGALAAAQAVYLTADSDECLVGALDPAVVYVVGGIVDRNRHKGLTARLAAALGIRTARLPIRESGIAMSASHVLTTNHVVDILCRVSANGGNWYAALAAVIPQRKHAPPAEGAPAPAPAPVPAQPAPAPAPPMPTS